MYNLQVQMVQVGRDVVKICPLHWGKAGTPLQMGAQMYESHQAGGNRPSTQRSHRQERGVRATLTAGAADCDPAAPSGAGPGCRLSISRGQGMCRDPMYQRHAACAAHYGVSVCVRVNHTECVVVCLGAC